MKYPAITLLLLALPMDAAVGRQGKVAQFADWSLACDNGGRCEAVSLSAGMDWRRGDGWLASPGEAMLRIVREPQADAPARIFVDHRMAGHHQSRERLVLRAVSAGAPSGRPLAPGQPGLEELEPGQVMAFVAESTGALEAEVLTAGSAAQRRARISTIGMVAALRRMDQVQGRAGTRGALVVRGDRPPAARRWPPLPVIRAVPGESGREASSRHAGASFDSETGEMIIRENLAPQPGRPAQFGNCGQIRTFAWNGRAFSLAEQREMPACAGVAPPYWLVTWRSIQQAP